MKTQKKLVTTTTRGKPVKDAATTRRTPSPAAANITILPGRDEIARRAYEIYVARGEAAGHDLEDWIQAERELLAPRNGNN